MHTLCVKKEVNKKYADILNNLSDFFCKFVKFSLKKCY